MRLCSLVLGLSLAWFSEVSAADGCLVVSLDQLTITSGTLEPVAGQDEDQADQDFRWRDPLLPVVILDADHGSAVVSDNTLAIKAATGTITGTVWLPEPHKSVLHAVRFSAEIPATTPAVEAKFSEIRGQYLMELLALGQPGGAWFRQQLPPTTTSDREDRAVNGQHAWRQRYDDEQLYDLFSGDRALAENLQLEGGLPVVAEASEAGEMTNIDTLPGVDIEPFSWTDLIKGLPVVKEPLAESVPADQHLLLFPSFAVLTATLDHSDAAVTGLLRGIAHISEDARTAERYQRQLCLEPSLLSKALGGQLINAVAITGSDASLRIGSDVAVIFQTAQTPVLIALLAARQQAAASESGGQKVSGTMGAVTWQGIVSPDRSRCAYLADLGGGRVVMTNSLAQLKRLEETAAGRIPAIATTPEFQFFRHRYSSNTSALLVLTDATIRRWCSARWRIGEARRLLALAALSDMQAAHLTTLPETAVAQDTPGLLGSCVLEKRGVRSSRYGSMGFITPVIELEMTTATEAEVTGYEGFRSNYERRWNGWFDPIAAELSIDGPKISADITVLPLIGGSDYTQLMRFTMGGQLAPHAGDPHVGTLAHLIVAIDRTSEEFGQAQGFLSMSEPKFGADPLSWLDGSIALYADADPFWDEVASSAKPEDFLEKNIARLPLALHLGVGDGLRLAVFLTAIHAYIDRSAPGTINWENETIGGKVGVRLSSATPGRGMLDNLVLYLMPGKDGLLVSASRDLIARAVARQGKPADAPPWLGQQAALRVTAELRPLLAKLGGYSQGPHVLRDRSWSNLTILNEWHRLFPGEDPVAVHQRFWHTRLSCPGGGSYVWNATIKTMESTVFGCPQAPKEGPLWSPAEGWSAADFGLTFEHEGVRAKAVLVRDIR